MIEMKDFTKTLYINMYQKGTQNHWTIIISLVNFTFSLYIPVE